MSLGGKGVEEGKKEKGEKLNGQITAGLMIRFGWKKRWCELWKL